MLENRINRVTVKNYKSLVDVTVELEDLTVLVGPNGSGKSNFLDVLHFVRDVLRIGLDAAFEKRGGYRALPGKNRDDNSVDIALDMTLQGKKGLYAFGFRQTSMNYAITHEVLVNDNAKIFETKEGRLVESIIDFEGFELQQTLLLPLLVGVGQRDTVSRFLRQMQFYTILPDNMRDPQPSDQGYPLKPDGSNVAAVLKHMQEEVDNTWLEQIYASLPLIVPGIITEKSPLKIEEAGDYLITSIEHENGSLFSLKHESDGTLRALGILTAIYQTPFIPLIGIEEPELMLFPMAQAVLADNFKEAAVRSQIILTTHSPDLISRFAAAALRLVKMVDGATQIGQVSEGDLAAINDQIFSSGDLLRIGALRLE